MNLALYYKILNIWSPNSRVFSFKRPSFHPSSANDLFQLSIIKVLSRLQSAKTVDTIELLQGPSPHFYLHIERTDFVWLS